MNSNEIKILEGSEIPFLLTQIPQPPKKLYLEGFLPNKDAKILCVVGSRRHSTYGEEVTKKLISGLAGYNICIVSGLAHGIDGIAHRAALYAGLQTVAFPGSGLDESVLYPSKHRKLAKEIVYAGGGLVSEFEMTLPAFEWTFPQRNRLMAGISHATLIIEARAKSGSQITTKLALDYNRTVGAVPGQITSALSEIPNELIRQGATPITNSDDILEMLGFERRDVFTGKFLGQRELPLSLNDQERRIMELLQIEASTNEQLVQKSKIPPHEINIILSSLEIQGLIKEVGGRFKPC